MHLLKKFPLILLLLTFALPGTSNAMGVNQTGVPHSLTTNSTQQITAMRMWMLKGWVGSGIPLSLHINMVELRLDGSSVALHDSTALLDDLPLPVFDADKSEVLVEIDIDPDTDSVQIESSVDVCTQLLLNKGNGDIVPFSEQQCRQFDGF